MSQMPVEQALRAALAANDLTLYSASGAHVFSFESALLDLARSLDARLSEPPSEPCPFCSLPSQTKGAGCMECRGRGTVGLAFRANRGLPPWQPSEGLRAAILDAVRWGVGNTALADQIADHILAALRTASSSAAAEPDGCEHCGHSESVHTGLRGECECSCIRFRDPVAAAWRAYLGIEEGEGVAESALPQPGAAFAAGWQARATLTGPPAEDTEGPAT